MLKPSDLITIIAFSFSFWGGVKELSVLANELPFLDVDSDSEGVVLRVFCDPNKSQRIEFNDGSGPWTILNSNSGRSVWESSIEALVPRRLFRAVESIRPLIVSHPSWKNKLKFPDEPFLSANLGESFETVKWVKFVIIINDAKRVFFQDSGKYLFHYEFATERLAPFNAMSVEEFNEVTLYLAGQRAVLGAVLVAPYSKEYAVQFVGEEFYPREMMKYFHQTVLESLEGVEEWSGYLMPTAAHAAALRADADYYEGHNIVLAEPDRWSGQSGCYVGGWALGRLKYIEHDQIDVAYRSGELLPSDILLTNLIPPELPFVSGILTFAPTTPNSHVSILAQSYGIPFAYLETEPSRSTALELDGKFTALRTSSGYFGSCSLNLFDASTVSSAYSDEILDLKATPELEIIGKKTKGSIVFGDLSEAWPEDICYIGGKAANFGFLRRIVPNNSPRAIAFTFDLWDSYLEQRVGNHPLREEIAARLEPFSEWPTDIAALDSALKDVREIIRDVADFPTAQRSKILEGLSIFRSEEKLRFRSSNNVEDSDKFVGAGLYESFSGCVIDDTDGDNDGPSHCDPNQPDERGVFRAMRKVYASFYNLNAYLERLRHGVDESEVGMALLVHHSFPDKIEAANGVATTERNFGTRTTDVQIHLVTQKGAVSVTNPEGGAIPEVVDGYVYRGSSNFEGVNLQQRSSLSRLGEEAVMIWEEDYLTLIDMVFQLGEAFVDHSPENQEPRLEFEYKKTSNGNLVIKQIREIPLTDHAVAAGVALIGSPSSIEVFQGEYGTAMGNHRLKSLWSLSGEDRWIDPKNETTSFIANAEVEIVLEESVSNLNGKPSLWPRHGFDIRSSGNLTYARDNWEWNTSSGLTSMWLDVLMPSKSDYEQDPIRAMSQLNLYFGADYAVPVLDFSFGFQDPNAATTKQNVVKLISGHPSDPAQEGSLLQTRSHSDGGISLQTEFYWPPYPKGPTAGYTAPMEKWVSTKISGLTSDPIVLRGYFSQTYRPGHHNFTESFVFEPSLEEGINPSQLAELREANVQQVFLVADPWGGGQMKIIGLDGNVRDP